MEIAVKLLKSKKAAGVDKITVEPIKEGGDELHKFIFQFISRIWKANRMPQDWKTGLIVPMPKREHGKLYGPLNVVYKILTSIIR